jgi:SAM-dependent methyltransferase
MRWASYETTKHLLASDMRPADDGCPICGSTASRSGRLLIQRDPDVTLLQCGRCLGLSASHMPTRELLDSLYRSYYGHGNEAHVIFQRPARLARHIVASMNLAAIRSGDVRIIDFGGGDGTIARHAGELITRLVKRPARIQVIDYQRRTPLEHDSVRVEFIRDVYEANDQCDLVIASGVFEHVPDLGSLLRQLVGRMREGGYLYARTVYALPFMRTFGVDMSYPAHVHDLGDAFWGNLPAWFPVPLVLAHSRPAIVETDLRQRPLRTVLAQCLKLPARLECFWTRNPSFKFYGGWEAVLQRTH